MRYYNCDVILTDVPNEISLAFSIAGCTLGCSGCFWKPLKNSPTYELTDEIFITKLNRYENLISCILFYGGEWHEKELISKLKIAKLRGLKTCLYTGRQIVHATITAHLDFMKTGRYRKQLGGLTNPNTNQKFINVITGENFNKLFWKTLPNSGNKS